MNLDYIIQAKNFMLINFMLINYKMINKFDNFLSFGFVTLVIRIVINIISSIYFALFAYKFSFLEQLIAFNLVFQFQQLIKLLSNYFINDKVCNETLKLLSNLDNNKH